MTDHTDLDVSTLGPNMWLVDEMYRRYRESPAAVGESWRDFFEGFRPKVEQASPQQASAQPVREASPRPNAVSAIRSPLKEVHQPGDGGPIESSPMRTDAGPPPHGARPLRGAAARIAQNMEASLALPTATSVRIVPAKLLEENRRVINTSLAARGGGRVSFTHLIGWAILNALEAVPAMKSSFLEVDGQPHMVRPDTVNFGLAVDVERKDGSRSLLVPNIKSANEMDFASFWSAYEDVIRKVRTNNLSPEDFQGTTVTLSNPGTIGTQLSVPRLMPGQGLIVATGRIDYPTEFQGADPATLSQLGVGKVIGMTSTYDHRVIQGAESGEFLAKVEQLLLGGDGFYEDVFASVGIPYKPVPWTADRGPQLDGDGVSAHEKQARVHRLVNMYRVRGHLLADLNPLGNEILSHPELDLSYHGLSVWDLDRSFFVDDVPGERRRTLREVLDVLRASYCQTIGFEYMHIQDPDQKQWIQHRVEGAARELGTDDKRHLLGRLNAAEAFERFLHSKYVGHKRFSLEGAESLIPMLDSLLEAAVDTGVERTVMGMAHRGRLNVLANIVGKSYGKIFREFEGDIDPQTIQGSGDVKYHVGATGKFTARSGRTLTVHLASNPSHLEAVDPVVEGMARATQDELQDDERKRVLPVLLHGDAAFAGEGVVAETFSMSALPGFTTGGTVHVVVNNQLGFTTSPAAARSSVYATDIAKMVQAPILHVNGDDPEACVWATRLAFDFRQAFRKDVVIDLVCYRRYGHNEGDDPSYTQPLMYAKIDARRSVRKLYMEALVNRGDMTLADAEAALEDYRKRLEQAFEETGESAPPPPVASTPPEPLGVVPPVETGVPEETLDRVLRAVTTWPEDFTPHPKLARQLERRRDVLQHDSVDWALAESLALGSLVLEGGRVRISGQDSRRGTFSQRHAVLVDYKTGAEYYPLANLSSDQAPFQIYDSPLNEFATLGFEYGYSVVAKDALTCWEAQFGDFVNTAQVVVDQFIVAAEDKWNQTSGLVVLLPHGYEGQGPEHSSARLERFLGLSAEDNIQVILPSTPAQYFHLLRRQLHRDIRKPLIVFTPKSLLRLPAARSGREAFVQGHFREVLPDPRPLRPEAVRGVIACSGKIFYDLDDVRAREGMEHVSIIRIEQLYPFPGEQILAEMARYPRARKLRWVQEEPENMGAYGFVHARLHRLLQRDVSFDHAARFESGSPATGSGTVHEQEQRELLAVAFRAL